jgi:integrase/recombinase XerC
MDLIISFLKYLEFEKRYSTRTIEAYKVDLTQFADFCLEKAALESVVNAQSLTIRDWVVYLLDSGCQNRSVNRKISALKSFYKYLLRNKVIEASPLNKIESLKNKKRLPVFVPESKMDQIASGINWGEGFNGLRNAMMFQMLYFTGMRLSELISLKESDHDQYNLNVKVLGKRNKERIIPVTPQFSSAIIKYIGVKHEIFGGENAQFLFVTDNGSKLYPNFVYRAVKSALSQVTTMDKRSPHVLRHTFATHMLNNGAEINAIKELLGHANLAATQVYTHNTFEKLKKIYKQAHPRA